MSFKYIEASDTIRGTDGSVHLFVGSKDYDFFHITSLEATADITVDTIDRIGTRVKGHKINTIEYSGSMTGYYGNPVLLKEFKSFVEGGAYPKMNIQLMNYDEDSNTGCQYLTLNNVVFSNLPLGKIDASTSALEVDMDFTFESFSLDDKEAHFFKEIEGKPGLRAPGDDGAKIKEK